MVPVPRVWDSPERRALERDPRHELARLARTFTVALDDWTESISACGVEPVRAATSGAKPNEPWFDDESEMMMTGRKPSTDGNRP
jgi:hypothetical protein